MISRPTGTALEVPGIKSAQFNRTHLGMEKYGWRGTAYHGPSGVEFDVLSNNGRWIVSDDEGKRYKSISLKRALRRAIGNQESVYD